MANGGLNLDKVLRLRLAVARWGEMDKARWWDTNGQLGPMGASVLQRGFPRTHNFAQARAAFFVAKRQCDETFPLKGAYTLWWLGDEIEEAFDAQWEAWLDDAPAWAPVFEHISSVGAPDLLTVLIDLGVVNGDEISDLDRLTFDASRRALNVGEVSRLDMVAVSRLAAGFARGAVGRLVVPYIVSAE